MDSTGFIRTLRRSSGALRSPQDPLGYSGTRRVSRDPLAASYGSAGCSQGFYQLPGDVVRLPKIFQCPQRTLLFFLAVPGILWATPDFLLILDRSSSAPGSPEAFRYSTVLQYSTGFLAPPQDFSGCQSGPLWIPMVSSDLRLRIPQDASGLFRFR